MRYAAPASLSAANAGSAATSSAATPMLVATDQVAWPSATPADHQRRMGAGRDDDHDRQRNETGEVGHAASVGRT
jgi:hypothetical protein